MKVEKLRTIKNFALDNKVTPSYVYRLIKEGKMKQETIDGVKFVDTSKFPGIPKK